MIQFILISIISILAGSFITIIMMAVGDHEQMEDAYRRGYEDGFHDAVK